jgi:predicted DsbA family dithiol-disulfide isomerase
MPSTIEIYADFICPWCHIALDRLTRLAKGRAIWPHWNPYLLRPDIPPGNVPLTSILPPDRLERAEIDPVTTDAFESGIGRVPNFVFASGRRFSGALPYGAFLSAVDASR